MSPVDVTGTLPSAVDSCSASYPQASDPSAIQAVQSS